MDASTRATYSTLVVHVKLKRETTKQREAVIERLPANEKVPLLDLSTFLT